MGLLSRTKKLFAGSQEAAADKKKKTARPKAGAAAKRSQKTEAAEPEKQAEQVVVGQVAGGIGLTLLLSEKSMKEQAGSVVAFRVKPGASKQQIAAAVHEQYGVKALDVRTMRYLPKSRRRGNTEGGTRYWKKAYVKVDDIQKINVAP